MMDELLVKYLLQEADADEVQQVEQWLEADSANRRYYEGLKAIWDESKTVAVAANIDENEAWKRFQQLVAVEEERKVIPFTSPKRTWKMTRMAAAIVALVVGGWLAYSFFGNRNSMHFESDGNILVCNLPDGSEVTLNKYSTLDYSKKENGNRSVKLTGEAFFDVAPDKQHPFVIAVADVEVKVVGTSFNIRADNEKTEVSVESGIVDVSKNSQRVQLLKDEKAIVTRGNHNPVKVRSTDNLYNYYRAKEIVCNGTPLHSVVNMLGEAYNTQIVIQNTNAAALPLNTTIPAGATLDDIVQMLATTFNLQVERKNNRIILK